MDVLDKDHKQLRLIKILLAKKTRLIMKRMLFSPDHKDHLKLP